MPRVSRIASLTAAVCLWVATAAGAQTPPPATDIISPQQNNSPESLQAQIRELRAALESMRVQLELLQRAADEQELLHAKVVDQEQTKVESGSKYHVRLTGLVVLAGSSTNGAVDNLDLPVMAEPRAPGDSGGSFNASARQSRLGLEMFGPTLGGARTMSDVSFDFFGGFPLTPDGVSAPLVRLRTATFTMEWTNASIHAGQEAPFFSPGSPTSLASSAYPPLSGAGNIWAWTPQVHVDHLVALPPGSTMVIQWGVLDPLTGEVPGHEYNRMATAGERSRIPAQALRVGWQAGADDRRATFGAGAYHANQNWGFGRDVHAWAATADWNVPLGSAIVFSGEAYRGRAIAGLGGGASASVLFDGPSGDATSAVRPVDSFGGWSQLKIKPASRLEINAVFGGDDPLRSRLARLLPIAAVNGSAVNQNASGFLNAIYQARSNLLFSVEYRRLWTTGLDDVTRTADHLTAVAGIVF